MRTLVLASLAGLSFITLASPSHAGTPWVDQRQDRQWNRIYDGIQSGRLTASEAASLLRGQAHVYRMERRFKSDGVVTLGERLRLHNALNRQSARIYAKKHN